MGSAFPIGILVASEPGIVCHESFLEPFFADCFHIRAVVRHENDQGILQRLPVLKLLHQHAHVVIDILDHAVACCRGLAVTLIQESFFIALRRDQRPMWSIQGNISEEGLVCSGLLFHPSQRSVKKYISTEALSLNNRVVMQKHIVEVLVLCVLFEITKAILSDSTGAMHEHFIESPVLRQIFISIPQMPFSKQSGIVASLL